MEEAELKHSYLQKKITEKEGKNKKNSLNKNLNLIIISAFTLFLWTNSIFSPPPLMRYLHSVYAQ